MEVRKKEDEPFSGLCFWRQRPKRFGSLRFPAKETNVRAEGECSFVRPGS